MNRHVRPTSLPATVGQDIRSGRVLVGDDLDDRGIRKWFAEEEEAFYEDDSGNSHVDPYYLYMRALTPRLGWRALRRTTTSPRSMLVLGPGPGLEVNPIIASDGSWNIFFVEASENFRRELSVRFPSATVLPATSAGTIAVASGSIDLVLALSVLHHIPNVSFVLHELARVLRPGGHLIVREPCSSMGDWSRPRSATPNERGISKQWMQDAAQSAGLDAAQEPIPVLFYPLAIVTKALRASWLMRTSAYRLLDIGVSRLVAFNDSYWREKWLQKLAPSAYFYVFRARPAPGTGS